MVASSGAIANCIPTEAGDHLVHGRPTSRDAGVQYLEKTLGYSHSHNLR